MKVGAVERLSPRTTLVRVEPGRPFPFAAGQAVIVGVATQDERRPLSIASPPAMAREAAAFDLLVAHDEDGALGPHLRPLAAGSILAVTGPVGRFSLPARPGGRHLVFIAGGTGIAPLRSMLGDALVRLPAPTLALVYSARTPAELTFHAEFVRLRELGRLDYRPTVTREPGPVWSGDRGRIDRGRLAEVVTPTSVCLVCGSRAFNVDIAAALTDVGVSPSGILTEQY